MIGYGGTSMNAEINGLRINYQMSGRGRPVVILHGWGARIESVAPIHRHLERHFTVYSLDLPGFGASQDPPAPWGSDDYKDLVARFLDTFGIDNPTLIGHSFGGKVSIRLAAERQVNKLVLIDSAGIRPVRTFSYYLRVYSYKAAKKLAQLPLVSGLAAGAVERFKNRAGSEDYRNASGVMRQTLVRAVNEDIRELLPMIKSPTLLVWGDNDTATPVADARLMEKLIPDAGLVVFGGAGHFSYLDKLNDFLVIIGEFLKNDMEAPRE